MYCSLFGFIGAVLPPIFDYQRWVHEKNCGKTAKKMGRPRTLELIREIIIRLARETGWGYRRILGELKKLQIHSVSRSTIKSILQEEGIEPSPKRGSGSWDEFLKGHVETLWQADFFSKMIWTLISSNRSAPDLPPSTEPSF